VRRDGRTRRPARARIASLSSKTSPGSMITAKDPSLFGSWSSCRLRESERREPCAGNGPGCAWQYHAGNGGMRAMDNQNLKPRGGTTPMEVRVELSSLSSPLPATFIAATRFDCQGQLRPARCRFPLDVGSRPISADAVGARPGRQGVGSGDATDLCVPLGAMRA